MLRIYGFGVTSSGFQLGFGGVAPDSYRDLYIGSSSKRSFTAEAQRRRVNTSPSPRLCGLIKQNIINVPQWYDVQVSDTTMMTKAS